MGTKQGDKATEAVQQFVEQLVTWMLRDEDDEDWISLLPLAKQYYTNKSDSTDFKDAVRERFELG